MPLAGAVLTAEDADGDDALVADARGMDDNSDAEELSTDELAQRVFFLKKIKDYTR